MNLATARNLIPNDSGLKIFNKIVKNFNIKTVECLPFFVEF